VRVLLTGGAGFIGSNLAHLWRALRPTDELVVLDALTYAGHRVSLAALEGSPGFSFVRGDVVDRDTVLNAMRGAELVLHLAAESHNDRAIAEPMPFVRTNVEGTANLLECARRLDVARFHHVSTDEVFGSLPLDSPHRFTLDSPYAPRSPYAASKAAADHLVRAWSETYGLQTTISNCGNNFGPFQHPEKLIPLAIVRLLAGEPFPLYGDGRNVRDWIYVEDHCRALIEIASRGSPGRTYLISAESERSNADVVGQVVRLLGAPPSLVRRVPDRPGHDRRYALDPTRTRLELGWAAETPFEEGMRRTVEWYRQHRDWWSPLLSSGTGGNA